MTFQWTPGVKGLSSTQCSIVLAQYYWCCKKLLRFNCRNKNDIDNDVDHIGINKHFFLIKRSHLMYLDFLIKLSYDVFTSFKRLNSIIEKVKILLCFHTLQEFFFFFFKQNFRMKFFSLHTGKKFTRNEFNPGMRFHLGYM